MIDSSLFIIIRMEIINFEHSTLSLQIFDLHPNYHNFILSNASSKLRKYFKRNRLTLQLELVNPEKPTLIDTSNATDQVYENKFELSIKARPIYKMTPSKSNRIYLRLLESPRNYRNGIVCENFNSFLIT